MLWTLIVQTCPHVNPKRGRVTLSTNENPRLLKNHGLSGCCVNKATSHVWKLQVTSAFGNAPGMGVRHGNLFVLFAMTHDHIRQTVEMIMLGLVHMGSQVPRWTQSLSFAPQETIKYMVYTDIKVISWLFYVINISRFVLWVESSFLLGPTLSPHIPSLTSQI
jgi:hypothetical protein